MVGLAHLDDAPAVAFPDIPIQCRYRRTVHHLSHLFRIGIDLGQFLPFHIRFQFLQLFLPPVPEQDPGSHPHQLESLQATQIGQQGSNRIDILIPQLIDVDLVVLRKGF